MSPFNLPEALLPELCSYLQLNEIISTFILLDRNGSKHLPSHFLRDREIQIRISQTNKRLLVDHDAPKAFIDRLNTSHVRVYLSNRGLGSLDRLNNQSMDQSNNQQNDYELNQVLSSVLTCFKGIDRLILFSDGFDELPAGHMFSSILQLASLRNVRSLRFERIRAELWAKPVDLSTVYFPHLSEFYCRIFEMNCEGGFEFLASHRTLTHLSFSPDLCDLSMLTWLLCDNTTLPNLVSLNVLHSYRYYETFESIKLIDALANTRMIQTDRSRPVTSLMLQLACSSGSFRAASKLTHLDTLEIDSAHPIWTDEFINLSSSSLSHLRTFKQCDHSEEYEMDLSLLKMNNQTSFLAFLETICQPSLTCLTMGVPSGAQLDGPAFQYLSTANQLRSLSLQCSEFVGAFQWLDWSYATIFNHLRYLNLNAFCLRRDQLIAIVCTTPELEDIEVTCAYDVHSFVATLIIGQHCPQITTIKLTDYDGQGYMEYRQPLGCGHYNPVIQMDELIQSPEEESLGHLFTRLSTLKVLMCKCTSSSVLSAFMSLFRSSLGLKCVQTFHASNLSSVMALSWLPALQSLSLERGTTWPRCLHDMLSHGPANADANLMPSYIVPAGCGSCPSMTIVSSKSSLPKYVSRSARDHLYELQIDNNMERSLFRFRALSGQTELDGRQEFFHALALHIIASESATSCF